jgi:hypothetical protein
MLLKIKRNFMKAMMWLKQYNLSLRDQAKHPAPMRVRNNRGFAARSGLGCAAGRMVIRLARIGQEVQLCFVLV